MIESGDWRIEIGLILSTIGHAIVALLFIGGLIMSPEDFGKQTIYSVTLEGGEKLGGISQLPSDDKKSKIAPPKKVESQQASVPKEEEKVKPVKETPKETKPDEKAEVSLNQKKDKEKEKEKQKPEPKKEEKKEETKKPPVKEQAKTVDKKSPPKKEQSGTDVNKELQKAMQRYLGESTDAGGKGFGAGAIGGTGMGGGTVMPESFHRYKRLLQDRIKSGWRWFDTSSSLIAEAIFEISSVGDISNVSISKSSGNSEFDRSVERAILKASPLPPPPPEAYKYFRTVRMIFDPKDL